MQKKTLEFEEAATDRLLRDREWNGSCNGQFSRGAGRGTDGICHGDSVVAGVGIGDELKGEESFSSADDRSAVVVPLIRERVTAGRANGELRGFTASNSFA